MRLLEKIKSVLLYPQKFFRQIKKERGIKQAFIFSVLLSPIMLVIGILIGTDASAALVSTLSVSRNTAVAVAFISGWLFNAAVPFIVATVYHLFALALKGKGKYDSSYKAAVYSSTPSYFLGWLWSPFVLLITIWSFVLSVIGLKELYALKTLKAFAVAVMPTVIIFLFYVIVSFFLLAGSPVQLR